MQQREETEVQRTEGEGRPAASPPACPWSGRAATLPVVRSPFRSTLALILALAGVGCGADPVGVTPASATEGSVGVLHVERFAGEGELEAGPTVLSAAFARYRGLDGPSVLGLLGSGAAASPESCAFVGADDALGADPLGVGSAEVELLDVGTIQVRVAGTEARLSPRAFPDLASVLAGVFYAGDAELAVPRADLDEYAFRAAGSDEIAAFDAVVPAPAEPAELRIDGTMAGEVGSLSRDGGFDVVWAAGDPRDTIEIEVRAHGDVLACAANDDGAFRVDAESLAILAPDGGATLRVRRVRVTPVDVPGLDDAYARVTVTRTVDVDLR